MALGQKTDYSISDSPEPDLNTVSIDTTHFDLHSSLINWPKIRVHVNIVNLTSPHPGAEVSTEISPQI
jgi:ABC-type taurine transport system substrate-binding protein